MPSAINAVGRRASTLPKRLCDPIFASTDGVPTAIVTSQLSSTSPANATLAIAKRLARRSSREVANNSAIENRNRVTFAAPGITSRSGNSPHAVGHSVTATITVKHSRPSARAITTVMRCVEIFQTARRPWAQETVKEMNPFTINLNFLRAMLIPPAFALRRSR